jgi:hypothetical protein
MLVQFVLGHMICHSINILFLQRKLVLMQFNDKRVELGQVEPKKFGLLANWQREYTMEDILTQLKKEMAAPLNRKLVQPPEGTYF